MLGSSGPGALNGLKRRPALSKSLLGFVRQGRLQCPKALCPQPWGQRVGGVSGRPNRATARSDPRMYPNRNGERHPGPQDAGRLRGLPEQCGSWSVRLGGAGLVPAPSNAPTTSGCPLEQRGGERCQRAPGARTLRGRRITNASTTEDTSFAHSRDPCSSIGTQFDCVRRKLCAAMCRDRFGIAVGQTCESRRNRHRDRIERTKRGSPRVTALQGDLKRPCVTRQKRKVIMVTVPARKRESRIFRPYVVCSCRSRQAASWSRISSHAALQKE
jgi:hypothetical protein